MIDPASQTTRIDQDLIGSALRIETDRVTCAVLAREVLTGLPAPRSAGRREAEIQFLGEAFDLPAERVFALRQVHGTASHRIGERALNAPRTEPGVFAEGDALFTREPDVLLVIRTADCLPVFFIFRNASSAPCAVGLIHAGWRGLRDGVLEATLRSACESFGTPSRVEVRIGPAIGQGSYEVGPEVAEEFPIATSRPGRPGKFWLDLAANAETRLRAWQEADSVPVDIMDELTACTFTANDRFYSHRRGDAGRNLNCIIMRGRT